MSQPKQVSRESRRPALRLVETKKMERDDWLEVRRTGIGGSDAAAAVGLNPFKSALALWMEKTGRESELRQPDPLDTTAPIFWGTLLEPIVAAAYTQQTGNKVRKVHAVLRHPTVPYMLANLDREIVGVPGVQILECKTAGEFGARLWKEGVPEYVQLQVQHQLAVTGKQAADVAVLLCGQKLEVHRIERDDALISHLIELEGHFWRHVTEDKPPPPDGSESADQALRALYPRDRGQTLDWSANLMMSAVFSDLLAVRQQLETQTRLEASLKQQIQQHMGEASRVRFERGSITWRRSKDSESVDLDRLWADHPELRQRYAVEKPGSRRFLIHDAPPPDPMALVPTHQQIIP
jgi:putative phage-type endonuclease